MAYCTLIDLYSIAEARRIAELTTSTGSVLPEFTDAEIAALLSGAAVTTILTDAIAYADARIDAALSSCYATPLVAPVPVYIKTLSARLTLAHLQHRKPVAFTEYDKENETSLTDTLAALKDGKQFVPGLTQTGGLPEVSGSRNEYDSRPYTEGTNDPTTINDGLTCPLGNF